MEKITLKQLALLWAKDKITLAQAKEKAQDLEYPKRVTDPDGNLWFDPPELEDNMIASVEGLIHTGEVTREKIDEFLNYVFR